MKKTAAPFLFVISVLFFFFIHNSCETMTKSKEFSCFWEPIVSAPKKFPMELLNADFIMPDETALSVFDDRFVYLGMGRSRCGAVYDKNFIRLLPTHVDAQWVSFSEKKVYSLYAELPVDQIKALFETGFEIRYMSGKVTKEKYKTIDLCLLPGGKVILYVKMGNHRIALDWQAQAEETHEYDDYITKTNGDHSMEEYYDYTLSNNADWMVVEEDVPFGLWDKYIELFKYYVQMNYENEDGVVTKMLAPNFTNGESWSVGNYDPRNYMDKMFSRPKDLEILWEDKKYRYTAYFYFNEEEVIRIFDEAFGDDRTQYGALEIFVSKYNNLFEISLCAGDKKIVFEKTEIRVFRDLLTDLDGESERIYKNYDGDHTNYFRGE